MSLLKWKSFAATKQLQKKNIIYGLNYHYSKTFRPRLRLNGSQCCFPSKGVAVDKSTGKMRQHIAFPIFYDTSWLMLLQKTNCFLFAASQSLFGPIYLRIWQQQFPDAMRNSCSNEIGTIVGTYCARLTTQAWSECGCSERDELGCSVNVLISLSRCRNLPPQLWWVVLLQRVQIFSRGCLADFKKSKSFG